MEGGDSRTAKGTSKATAWKREGAFGEWAYLAYEENMGIFGE